MAISGPVDDSAKGARLKAEPCYIDANGKPADAGLHQLEPDDAKAYYASRVASARAIGLPEEAIQAIYGKDEA
jgi:hypothetical protein